MKICILSYSELQEYCKAFSDGNIGLMVIIGRPGIQKSSLIRKTLTSNYRWIEGNVTAFQLYCETFLHKDKQIVIDDVDSLYSNKSSVRLLKSLCQTESLKRISWLSATKLLCERNIPCEFETKSHVCIISNDWKSINKNVSAIEDRGIVINFNPSNLEVHENTCRWFDDKEILGYVGENLEFCKTLSMRDYINAKAAKISGLDWKDLLYRSWNVDSKFNLIRDLFNKPYLLEKNRINEFVRLGLGSRATYFRTLKTFGK